MIADSTSQATIGGLPENLCLPCGPSHGYTVFAVPPDDAAAWWPRILVVGGSPERMWIEGAWLMPRGEGIHADLDIVLGTLKPPALVTGHLPIGPAPLHFPLRRLAALRHGPDHQETTLVVRTAHHMMMPLYLPTMALICDRVSA